MMQVPIESVYIYDTDDTLRLSSERRSPSTSALPTPSGAVGDVAWRLVLVWAARLHQGGGGRGWQSWRARDFLSAPSQLLTDSYGVNAKVGPIRGDVQRVSLPDVKHADIIATGS